MLLIKELAANLNKKWQFMRYFTCALTAYHVSYLMSCSFFFMHTDAEWKAAPGAAGRKKASSLLD